LAFHDGIHPPRSTLINLSWSLTPFRPPRQVRGRGPLRPKPLTLTFCHVFSLPLTFMVLQDQDAFSQEILAKHFYPLTVSPSFFLIRPIIPPHGSSQSSLLSNSRVAAGQWGNSFSRLLLFSPPHLLSLPQVGCDVNPERVHGSPISIFFFRPVRSADVPRCVDQAFFLVASDPASFLLLSFPPPHLVELRDSSETPVRTSS